MSRNNEAMLEEARLLLPWYLTGQLSTTEQELVDNALHQYPSLQDELRHEEQIQKLVCQDAQLLELSALDTTSQRLDNLLRLIGREDEQKESLSNTANVHLARPVATPAKPKASQPSRWKTWLQGLFDAEWLTPANAVLAGLLVCSVGVGTSYITYIDYQQDQLAADQKKLEEQKAQLAADQKKLHEEMNQLPSPNGSVFKLSGDECPLSNDVFVKIDPNHEKLIIVEFKPSATYTEIQEFLVRNQMRLVSDMADSNLSSKRYILKLQTDLTEGDEKSDPLAEALTRIKENSTEVVDFLAKSSECGQ